MSDYEVIQVVSKYPDKAAEGLVEKVKNYKKDGYKVSGSVSTGTTYNEDGEPQIVLSQAMVKDDD